MLSLIKRDFNSHVGRVFEDVCKQYLEQKKLAPFTRIGAWWGNARDEETKEKRTEEIDVVSIDENTKTILFAECKWQENVNAASLLDSLKKKTSNVVWCNEERKERYALFAKSFKRKIVEEGVYCIDARDLDKTLS